jgi:deoxycytidine triphosphate deaminase
MSSPHSSSMKSFIDQKEWRASMVLNRDNIKALQIIQKGTDKGYRDASYDLAVGTIITSQGDQPDFLWLQPQAIVRVISQETIKVPLDIVGFVTVKTSLCDEGILPLNIGIIDPGYQGLISTTLLNFGKRDFLIEPGKTFLRVTFHQFTQPKEVSPIVIDEKTYKISKIQQAQNFSNSFLNITGIEQKIIGAKGEVKRWLTVAAIIAGIVLAFFPFLVTLGVDYTSRTGWTKDQFKTEILKDVKEDREGTLEKKIQELENKLDELRNRVPEKPLNPLIKGKE